MRHHWFVTRMALLAALGVLAAGAARADEKGGKAAVYQTPQEVFQAAVAALKQGHYRKAVQCLTPESRDTLAGLLASMEEAAMHYPVPKNLSGKELEKFQARKKALQKVLDKHGIGEAARKAQASENAVVEIARHIKDPEGFIADVIRTEDLGQKITGELKGEPKLEDLKIDGDSAKGVVVATTKNGRESREPVQFKKVGQGWKIKLVFPKIFPDTPSKPPSKK